MKLKIVAATVAMALATPAWAGDGPLSVLAQASGLTERKVNMIVGARTAFAEYPYTYYRALKKFQAAIGKDNYERLMNGESIAVEHNGEVHIVSLDRVRTESGNIL